MANNYTMSSTLYRLTPDQVERAEEIIEKVGKQNAGEWERIKPEDEGYAELEPQIEFEYEIRDDGLWIYFEESCNPDFIADVISELQVEFKADKPFTFSYCYECSKPRLDEFGGGSFCIMPDGKQYHTGSQQDALERANNPFWGDELTSIFEIAHKVMQDDDMLNQIADSMDISDQTLEDLENKLKKHMNKE